MDQIHDGRERHWFYIDNTIMDDYAAEIGVTGLAVYIALIRHANSNGCAYPSLRRLERLLNISRTTLVKYLDILERKGIISRQHRTSTDGDATSTMYTIMSLGGGSRNEPPGPADEPRVVHVMNHGGPAGEPEGLKISKDLGDLKDLPPCLPTEDIPPLEKPVAKRTGKPKTSDYSPGFVRFWDSYPHTRRLSKSVCMDIWSAASLETRTDEIVEKVERLKVTSWLTLEPRFIPLMKTWLNDRRYDDDLMEMSDVPLTGGRVSPKAAQNIEVSRRIIEEMDRERNGQSPILLSTQHDG